MIQVLFWCFMHKQRKWKLWIPKERKYVSCEERCHLDEVLKMLYPARDNEQTSLSCATLTHYHPEQTGCGLHRALLPNDSSSCDKSFTLTRFHLLSEPLLDRWEKPQCLDARPGPADNAQAQLSYAMSGNISQTGPCRTRYQFAEMGKLQSRKVTQNMWFPFSCRQIKCGSVFTEWE